MKAIPTVTVVSYGGTIASTVRPGVGAAPSLDIGAMAKAIPAINEVANVRHQQSKQVASSHMTVRDLLDIRVIARDAIAQGSSGVVVTQGTDTIEEIAFGIDLLHQCDQPIVVTGAMRNASLPGADGPSNLVAAIQVAAAPAARGLGALVVMNDEIHAARFVRKSHTANPSAFRSFLSGPLGWVAENDVRIALKPSRRPHVAVSDNADVPPVALYKVSLGDDGRLLPHVTGAGFAGLVIEGFGGGHVTQYMAAPEILDPLVAAMPVVLASRAGNGEVLRRTYGGFAGSETELISRGVIFAGALDGPKARVLLTLLLAAGIDRERIAKAFAEIGSVS